MLETASGRKVKLHCVIGTSQSPVDQRTGVQRKPFVRAPVLQHVPLTTLLNQQQREQPYPESAAIPVVQIDKPLQRYKNHNTP